MSYGQLPLTEVVKVAGPIMVTFAVGQGWAEMNIGTMTLTGFLAVPNLGSPRTHLGQTLCLTGCLCLGFAGVYFRVEWWGVLHRQQPYVVISPSCFYS